jgi:4-hydroxy-tetrahydrodipicolinate synthase
MPSPILSGVVAALWIPTDTNGRLLDDALRRQIALLKTGGCHGILALGSTGEFVHFSEAERAALLARITELAAPLPVMANVSDVSPHVAVRLARVAKSVGCVGTAVLPPWYFAVGDDDQLAFFLRVAEATDLPTLLYNFPERVGNRISLATIAAFADRALMGGVKQSGAEFSYHHELVALGRAKGFPVFTGADTRLPETLALGCAGTICGLANLVPGLLTQTYAACTKGSPADANIPASQLTEIGRIMSQVPFPLDVSAGVLARGLDPGAHKSVVSAATEARYDRVVAELRAKFAEWRLPPAA